MRTLARVTIAQTLLIVAMLLAVACAHRIEVVTPERVSIHGARIDAALWPFLDSALATGVEKLWQIDSVTWVRAENHAPHDSVAIVTAITVCTTIEAGAALFRGRCPNMRAPMIHTHPQGRCSPSRQDYETQVQLEHRFDLIYCAYRSGGHPYWLWTNPLVVERLAARARDVTAASEQVPR